MKTPLSQFAWALALVLHIALIGGIWWWAGLAVGFLLILPLMAAVRGLIRKSRYTAGWMTLLVSGYCAALLGEAYAVPSRHQVGVALALVAAVEFAALTLFVRWSARENGVARI
ncbi:DUF2069 domain-containing protein [Nevskia sp.]|uniref:DUF2069 domain-containing protein n=1 Tax=Nevskia sp. TaxID=1929292 RepID=UPI0025D0FB8E|nr:DUF2069 domain-containing protein [Nevskia sp.]